MLYIIILQYIDLFDTVDKRNDCLCHFGDKVCVRSVNSLHYMYKQNVVITREGIIPLKTRSKVV